MNLPSIHQLRLIIKKNIGSGATEVETQAEYDRLISEIQVEYNKQLAKSQYESDVYNEMLSIFGTTKTDTAIANYETLKLKVSKPELFGTDTATIAADAQTKIDQIEAYVVYRETRYSQYLTEIAAIESN